MFKLTHYESISYSVHTIFPTIPSHEEKLIKHNANDDVDTERVEEKLLYQERWLLALNLPF